MPCADSRPTNDGLEAGDVGTVVYIHPEAAANEVEFTTLTGQTFAVATVLPTQLRPVGKRDARPRTGGELRSVIGALNERLVIDVV